LKGRVEHSLQQVGLITVIGGSATLVLLFLIGVSVLLYFIHRSGNPDQARTVNTIVNESFTATSDKPASFKITFPSGAKILELLEASK
jgi:hypothetical protein